MRRVLYELARVGAALGVGTLSAAALLLFLCPVLEEKQIVSKFKIDTLRFVPAWRRGEMRLDWDWVGFELLFGLGVVAVAWFIYPHCHSPPRRVEQG